jgi:hypothetical protein
MGNETAVEAATETMQQPEASKGLMVFYWVVFVAPVLVAVGGAVGYLQWTMAGFPSSYTIPWVATFLAGTSWAYTHWFAFLRRKPSDS